MKLWISMLILILSVIGFCVWDIVYTNKIFSTLQSESKEIYTELKSGSIENKNLQTKIENLNAFWTEKMDTLCISISRKDLQPISDYLQYLISSTINNNQEDAITYSRLLWYNIVGLSEVSSFSSLNIL